MDATECPGMGFSWVMNEQAKDLVTDLDGAFGTMVETLGPQLFWGLRRICGDHQEAEDLTQETFIRAYRALSGYDESRIAAIEPRPWLWTIAMNLGRNHLRDRSRRPTYVELGFEGRSEDPEPVDSAAWDSRFAGLNRHQRTAVVLRHVIGMGVGEISAATGRPEGTVKADIHRGLARLREVMESEE